MDENSSKVPITWEDGIHSVRQWYSPGERIRLPEQPSREGRRFQGWWTQMEGGQMVTEDMVVRAEGEDTFFARWDIKTHDVRLFIEDNGVPYTTIQVPHGGQVADIPAIQQTGYVFEGWYSSDGVKLKDTTRILRDSDFHSHWRALKWKVRYDSVDPESGILDDEIMLPSPLMVEYTVDNWGYSPERMIDTKRHNFVGWEPPSIAPGTFGRDIVFTGQWQTRQYTIRLDLDGGKLSDGGAQTSWKRTYNQTICDSELPTPVKEGHEFRGWKCDSIEASADMLVTKDMVLVAQWQVITFTVTKYPISTESKSEARRCTWGSTIPSDFLEPPDDDRENWKWIGWYTQAFGGEPVDDNTVVKSDLTIFGIWQNTARIKIVYDANGGTFDQVEMEYDASSETGVASISIDKFPVPERSGYVFKGWMEDDSSSSVIASQTYETSEDCSLYAKWTEDKVTLKLNSNGGVIMRTNGTEEED